LQKHFVYKAFKKGLKKAFAKGCFSLGFLSEAKKKAF